MSFDLLKYRLWETAQEKALDTAIVQGKSLHLKGLSGSLKTLLLSLLAEHLNIPVLAVFTDREEAEWAFEELDLLFGEGRTGFFPGGGGEDADLALLNPRKTGMRMEVLRDLQQRKLKIVITTMDGIVFKIPPPQYIADRMIRLIKGEEQDPYILLQKLIEFGYSRESVVEAPGEINIRGGILDIFPFTGELPHRIEFYGDTVESIRTFDIASQLSTGKSGELVLVPSTTTSNELTASLFHYFPSNRLVFIEDPEFIQVETEKEKGREKKDIWTQESLESFLNQSATLFHHTLYGPKKTIDLGGRKVAKLGLHSSEIRAKFISFAEKRQGVWIVCEDENHKERLRDFLQLNEEPAENINLVLGPIKRGFSLPAAQLLVYTENDLFGRVFHKPRRGRFKEGIPIRALSALNPGDFVVHVDYGIGKYIGLEKIKVRDMERECLALVYSEGDKLYVPVDKMERVQKFRGRDGINSILSKLGGTQWEKLKSKTKESVKAIAKDLIVLYSARQALPGYAFSPDTAWQKEIELGFAFEETPDQSKAIEDVKEDMEKPRPMDRLVCGDVGFGKQKLRLGLRLNPFQMVSRWRSWYPPPFLHNNISGLSEKDCPNFPWPSKCFPVSEV